MQPLFSIRRLAMEFPGTGEIPFRALSGIDLDIYEGECLIIAGSNGSGKTLLMRIISGLLEPTSGGVWYRGHPLQEVLRRGVSKNTGAENFRAALGIVFQDADSQIIGETVEEDVAFGPENLKLSREEVTERVERSLAAMGLLEKREMPPRNLSGGEKRRLAVAGVLAMGCSAVIMDEPFANLDWPGVVQTLAVIRELKASGKTLIILTHELEKALAFAGRLIILHKGEIRCDASPQKALELLDPAWGVRDPRGSYASAEDCSWLAE
jgi:biotin transport system ATP-binding protein